MSTSLAEITAEVAAALKAEMPDAVRAGEIFEIVEGAYDETTASHPQVPTSRATGDIIIDQVRPVRDLFPDHVPGPQEQLVFMIGFAEVPKKGWLLSIDGGDNKTFLRVQDILGAGSTFYAVVR